MILGVLPWWFLITSQLFAISKSTALILSELWASMDVLLDTEDLHGINTDNTNIKNCGSDSTSSKKCRKNMVANLEARNRHVHIACIFFAFFSLRPSGISPKHENTSQPILAVPDLGYDPKKFMSVTTQKFHCISNMPLPPSIAPKNPLPNLFQRSFQPHPPLAAIAFSQKKCIAEGGELWMVMMLLQSCLFWRCQNCGDCFVNKSCHLHHLLLQQGDGNPRTDSIREVRQCRMPRRSKMAWHFTPVWLTRQHENLWDLWGSSTWAFLVFPITFPHFLYCPSQLLVSKSSCYQFALRRYLHLSFLVVKNKKNHARTHTHTQCLDDLFWLTSQSLTTLALPACMSRS